MQRSSTPSFTSNGASTGGRFASGWIRPMVWLWLIVGVLCSQASFAQNVSIGTATANNSALLHLESTTKGLLIPRLTNTQMLAVVTPATGDLVYNTTYNSFYYYNGSFWTALVGSGWSLLGDAGTSASVNFLGTIDSVDLVQRTNNHERMRVIAGSAVSLTNTLNSAERLILYEPSGSGTLYTAFKAGRQDSTVRYTLPLSDGTNGQALCDSLGTLGWKTFGTVGGGFGDTLWKRGSGTQSLISLGTLNKANGKYTIASTENCTASGYASSVFGDSNSSSAQDGCVTGGSNNSVSGTGSAVVRGGAFNSAGSQNTMIVGGQNNSTSGQDAVVLGGDSNNCSGAEAVIINGDDNSFASQNNLVFGHGAHPTGQNQLIFYPPTSPGIKTGFQNTSPAEALDVTGNVRLDGTGLGILKPNGNSGTSGQKLLSAGPGASPTWGTVTIPSTNWNLTGNFGTTPPTNFIGTTDTAGFAMRTSAIERARIQGTGNVGIGSTAPTSQLTAVSTNTGDEYAAVFANATGNTSSQTIAAWGRTSASGSNTGSIAVLATGSGNTSAGSTNVALQISQGEFAMGRTTQSPSVGTTVEAATGGTAYSQEGPSGVIQLVLSTDLSASSPTAGVYQNLGTVTVNNRYITANSIILANVVSKIDGGTNPSPKNSVYKVDVESRTAGSCVLRIGMIPFVTDPSNFQGSDYIRVGYVVINPGR